MQRSAANAQVRDVDKSPAILQQENDKAGGQYDSDAYVVPGAVKQGLQDTSRGSIRLHDACSAGCIGPCHNMLQHLDSCTAQAGCNTLPHTMERLNTLTAAHRPAHACRKRCADMHVVVLGSCMQEQTALACRKRDMFVLACQHRCSTGTAGQPWSGKADQELLKHACSCNEQLCTVSAVNTKPQIKQVCCAGKETASTSYCVRTVCKLGLTSPSTAGCCFKNARY